jgi:serine/threonine protein kinase
MGCPDAGDWKDFPDGTDPLRAEELARHLGVCASCRTLAPRRVLDDPTLPHEVETPLLPRGLSVGRYVVLERIGEGGMGVVYAAHDPELDRKVALKVLRVDPSRDVAAVGARMQREAQALARLSHPNVISVHDVGTSPHGVFLAMELVDGETLGQWLRQKRDWRAQLDVFLRAGQGLAAAHHAGLVHRDFKPDNVLVGKDGRVHVTDFGLARMAGSAVLPDDRAADSPLRLSLTHTGVLLGTPAYMAPEQMSGDPIDARADVFSFCVALYEALYQQRPFAGSTLDELRRSIALNHVREPAPGAVPEGVRRALLRGLRAAPSERYAAIDELLLTLEVAVRPIPPRPRRWGRATLAWGLPALGGVVAAIALLRSPQSTSPPPAPPQLRPAEPLAITLTIGSQPPGAALLRVADGIELGTTPFVQRLTPTPGIMRLVLRLPGYVDAPLDLPTDRDGERNVALQKLPPPVTRPPRAKPPRPRSQPPIKLDDPFEN